jgi:5-methylcytosine-specific restriction endonuclease McrA
VRYQPVDAQYIYDRDRWICQLCRKRIHKTKQVPHPLAATLDHITPLALGGHHEPANLQAAHFICNSRKGASGAGDQLLLFG